jgi:GTP-binding protein HflX
LIAAFRATLEEVREADILLHVADGSHPRMAEQIMTVNKILEEVVEVGEKKMVYAINKMDKADIHEVMAKLPKGISNVCFISALQQRGISALLDKIGRILEEELCLVELTIPYERGDILSLLYEKGRVLGEDFGDKGINILARVPVDLRDKILLLTNSKGK